MRAALHDASIELCITLCPPRAPSNIELKLVRYSIRCRYRCCFRGSTLPGVDNKYPTYSSLVCLSLLLAKSGRVFPFFLLAALNLLPPLPFVTVSLHTPHPYVQRHRFRITHDVKRPEVALHAIGPLFLLPIPSSPHCILKVSKHDSLSQSPDATVF